MKHNKKEALMKELLVLLLVLCWPGLARADAVLDWNATAFSAAFAAGLDNSDGCVDPLHESRIFAMMHAAIHDALNAIERRFQPYALGAQAPAGTSPEVLSGPIREEWVNRGAESGELGYPTSDEYSAPDGISRIVRFQRG